MLAKELKAGDVHLDNEGDIQITVLSDAVPDGVNHLNGKPQVHVGVQFSDGGHAPRWFDADDEVPYVRPKPEES